MNLAKATKNQYNRYNYLTKYAQGTEKVYSSFVDADDDFRRQKADWIFNSLDAVKCTISVWQVA